MNPRLANLLALLLIASGALFVAYAALSQRSSPVAPSTTPISHTLAPTYVEDPAPESAAAVNPSPLGEGGPSGPGEGLMTITAQSAVGVSSGTILKSPPDSSDSADRAVARRQAAILWVGLALPLLFITFVLIVVLRRLRPPPMKHSGPSDTTDLWQEAGKRMK